MITPCAVLEGGERVGRGGRGKPFGKGLPLPPRAPPSPLPKLFIQVHATVSQRPGQPSRSGPPVPWRDCTVEGRASLPCRHIRVGVYIRVPARQRKTLSGRLRATDSERTRGGGSGTRARASLSGFLGMTGSRPAQRTVWTNPALWSATNQGNFFFSGQGPVGGAGILHGRRAVRRISAQRQEPDRLF